MKMHQMMTALLCAGILASASAFADDVAAPQGGNGEVKQQLSQDKATVKADRTKLQADRQKLREDRKAAKVARKGHKHKNKKKLDQPTEQPKSS